MPTQGEQLALPVLALLQHASASAEKPIHCIRGGHWWDWNVKWDFLFHTPPC